MESALHAPYAPHQSRVVHSLRANAFHWIRENKVKRFEQFVNCIRHTHFLRSKYDRQEEINATAGKIGRERERNWKTNKLPLIASLAAAISIRTVANASAAIQNCCCVQVQFITAITLSAAAVYFQFMIQELNEEHEWSADVNSHASARIDSRMNAMTASLLLDILQSSQFNAK